MKHALPFLLFVPLSLLDLGCGLGCDRAGCDAMEHPITDAQIQSGIAGQVASESDLVTNGCQECPLSRTTLTIRTAEAPVTTTEEAQALVDGQNPPQELTANERFEQKLDPGDYLVCHEGFGPTECAALTIGQGEVFTVNVNVGYGLVEITVFAPGSSEPTTKGLFHLSTGA